MKVLIIVDPQNDFCPGGPLGVDGGHEIIAPINALMHSGEFDLVIVTQDWHPADHVSIVDNHPGRAVFEAVETSHGLQILWPKHCVENTPGAELHPELDREKINYFIRKGTDREIDSYSGFFDNGKLKETELRSVIQREAWRLGAEKSQISLSICGLALDFCVAATARDAVELGFNTELIVDATRAVCLNPGDDLKTLRDLASIGVQLVTSKEILPSERLAPREINLHLGM